MSDTVPITLNILGKEYRVACPEGEDVSLQKAAKYLQDKMKEIKMSGKIIGADRIAVMAALNITHELLTSQSNPREQHNEELSEKIQSMRKKIDQGLHPHL